MYVCSIRELVSLCVQKCVVLVLDLCMYVYIYVCMYVCINFFIYEYVYAVTTQNEALRKRFPGTPENVVTYFGYVAEEVRQIIARLGSPIQSHTYRYIHTHTYTYIHT